MEINLATYLTAITGTLLGDFSEFHAYVEHLLDRPVLTHEFASNLMTKEIKDKALENVDIEQISEMLKEIKINVS